MHILFLDTETTDLNDDARLVQLAYKNAATSETVNEYFNPTVPISYGAMAVHHVTNEMVADKPVFSTSPFFAHLVEALEDGVVVAHNAPFDIKILKNEGVDVTSYIDTVRVARHLIESEQYKLQYLRYFLKLNVQNSAFAHNALGDIQVLEALYAYLQVVIAEKFGLSNNDEILKQMFALTNTPVLLRTFTFGKYLGKPFQEIASNDRGYLEWLYGSESKKAEAEQNQELIFTLKHHLEIT